MPQDKNKLIANGDDDPATSDESLLETALRRYGDWWAGGGVSKMLGVTPPTAAEYAQGFGTDAIGGMIAGRNALTANKAALAIAEDMAKRGKNRSEIFGRTGWWQGPDKEWRYEIHDPPSSAYTPGDAATQELERRSASPWETAMTSKIAQNMMDTGFTVKANALLAHPDLYAAYPSLGRANVRFDPTLANTNLMGSYRDTLRGPAINVNPDDAFEQDIGHSLLSHELQHGVQSIEGFAPGSSPDFWRAGGASEEEAQNIYHRAAGEVEARTVQRRLGLSPVQRQVLPPFSQGEHGMDVPEEQQLIFDTNGHLRSLEPVEGNPFEEEK